MDHRACNSRKEEGIGLQNKAGWAWPSWHPAGREAEGRMMDNGDVGHTSSSPSLPPCLLVRIPPSLVTDLTQGTLMLSFFSSPLLLFLSFFAAPPILSHACKCYQTKAPVQYLSVGDPYASCKEGKQGMGPQHRRHQGTGLPWRGVRFTRDSGRRHV
jgi:hypothetical protein